MLYHYSNDMRMYTAEINRESSGSIDVYCEKTGVVRCFLCQILRSCKEHFEHMIQDCLNYTLKTRRCRYLHITVVLYRCLAG